MNVQIDVREVLPVIRVPTLVVHRTGDRLIPVEQARYIAARIPGARLLELPGDDHIVQVGDVDSVVDEIEEFLTGARPAPEPERALATILFADIPGSTQTAVQLGDRRWRAILDAHDAAVRASLARWRGRLVNTMGEGSLAVFDGPARGIRCALDIAASVAPLDLEGTLRPAHRGGGAARPRRTLARLRRRDLTVLSCCPTPDTQLSCARWWTG
jgi:hypothetical protein